MTKHKAAGEYTNAVGRGATTAEVAEKLQVSEEDARHNLIVLRGLKILVEISPDNWRKP